jgi:hypothetical protein
MAKRRCCPAYRGLESLCGDGGGLVVDPIRGTEAGLYAGQELGLTSAMRKKPENNGSYSGDIASDPPDAARSFYPRQVKDDPTSQRLVLPEGPGSIRSDRALRSGHQVGKRSHRTSDKSFYQQVGKRNVPAVLNKHSHVPLELEADSSSCPLSMPFLSETMAHSLDALLASVGRLAARA